MIEFINSIVGYEIDVHMTLNILTGIAMVSILAATVSLPIILGIKDSKNV